MTERVATQTSPRPARLRRLIVEPSRPPARPAPALTLLALAVWTGLAVGLLELGLTWVLKPLYDPSPGLFRGNRHTLWMIPVTNLAVFGACGLGLALGARRRPRLATFTLVFLAILTLLLVIRGLFPFACAALAAWAVVVPRVRPQSRPRASASQCGAPSPAKAGTR